MRAHRALLLGAAAALFSSVQVAAQQVPRPINAPSNVTPGHIITMSGGQQASDSGAAIPLDGAFGGFQTLRALGAVGNGSHDDSAALTEALRASGGNSVHPYVDGEDLTYAVSGNFNIHSNLYLRHVRLKQLDPGGSSRRTLTTDGNTTVTNVVLEDVTVDRNGTTADNDRSNAAGIWAVNFSDWRMRNVEVTGNGMGFGIQLLAGSGVCQNLIAENLYVHDINFVAAVDPAIQSVTLVHETGCNHLKLVTPVLDTALSTIGNIGDPPSSCYTQIAGTSMPCGYPVPYQTNGFSIGAPSSDIEIISPYVTNVATGADHGGGLGALNKNIRWRGGYFYRIGDFGIAFKHCKDNVSAIGVTVEEAGLAGFFANGGASGDSCAPSNIEFGSDTSKNIGAPYNYGAGSHQMWPAGNAGFNVASGATTPNNPVNVSIHDSTVVDNQGSPTTQAGILLDTSSEDVRIWNNVISGAVLSYQNVANYSYMNSATGLTTQGKATFNGGLVTANSDVKLNGRLGWDRTTVTLVNGDNANIPDPNAVRMNISGPNGAFSVSGIVAPTSGGGFHCLRNTTTAPFTILNNSSNSSVGNRILTRSGADLVVAPFPNNPEVCLDYDGAALAWTQLNGASAAGLVPLSTLQVPAANQCAFYSSSTAAAYRSCGGDYTVAGLPTCNSGNEAARVIATDILTATFGTTAVGGGSNRAPVTCVNNTWVVG